MHVLPLSEPTQVRLASRVGAVLLVFLLGWCALQNTRPRAIWFDAPPGANVVVSVFARTNDTRAAAPPSSIASDFGQLIASSAGETASTGQAVRLWDESADGRILFLSAEQYLRCRDARARRADAADCPGLDEARAFGLAVGDEAEVGDGLSIDRAQLRRGHWR